MTSDEQENCKSWLYCFYESGSASKDIAQAVMQGFRNGDFSAEGYGAFALVAFLHGVDSNTEFNLLSIIDSAKV